MDQSALKTTWKQRLAIIVIAVLLLGITVATYVGLVISDSTRSSSSQTDDSDAKMEEIYSRYTAKQSELDAAAAAIAPEYYSDFLGYRSEIKAFNEETANASGLQTEDFKVGDGTEITGDWKEYFAYYIGYCADESIFDSSFDDSTNPTALKTPIDGSRDFIAGWNQGVLGMKIGGVRQLTIPGELAYGDTRDDLCGGGTNKPLRFIIMAVDPGEEVRKLNAELTEIIAEYNAALYSAQ